MNDQDEAGLDVMPSQTVGPYVHIGLVREGSEIISDAPDAIEVTVTVVDGDGNLIDDAMIEIWQPDSQGIFNSQLDPRTGDKASDKGFRGLGRGFADDTGTAAFRTIVPGAVESVSGFGSEAPHLKLGIFARGMLERLYTRLYFPEFSTQNETDPVLCAVPQHRRQLLIADKTETGYHLTINVQHKDPDKETPFFDIQGE